MSITHLPPGEGKSVWIANNELVTFKAMGKDTGGAFALVEVVGLPGSGPPPHIHHSVDEVYCLLEGELEVLNGERTFTAKAGSVFHIPKGTLHAWRNATTKPTRTLLLITWRYERMDGASHWIPLDQPQRLNSLLLEFLPARSA